MQQCDGTGVCLEQTIDHNTYGKYSNFPCTFDCRPQPCPNVIICGSWQPQWLVGLKRIGVCIDCDSKFHKKLDIVENIECPMCLEITTCVIQPNCTHPTCITCFKRCMYGQADSPPPMFPYSDDIENEYFEDLDDDTNPKWDRDYPLIKKWRDDYNKWELAKDMKYAREQSLRICPICRR